MYLYRREKEITDSENIKVKEYCQSRPEREHQHDFIELIYIKSGHALQKIDSFEYKVSHGDLLFVNYSQTHSFAPDGYIKYVNILLEPKFLSNELIDSDSIMTLFAHSMFAEFSEPEEFTSQCVRFSGKELCDIDMIIEMMITEYKDKKTGYSSILHGCVRILFTKLLRRLNYCDEKNFNEIMPDILEYIDRNCSERILLSDIAAKSFYNPAYFSRLLKQYCGKSFSVYIKEKRIGKAASLLLKSNVTIEQVMQQSGYSDRKLFYKHFKEIYGVSPGEFRKGKYSL